MRKQEKLLHILVIVFLAIQPIIDMDYLIYDFLDQFGLPRLSTILRFVVVPLLLIFSFILRDKKKKRTFIAIGTYGVLLLVYFVLHAKQAASLVERLAFTDNFYFNTFQELTYVLTLVIPYFLVYLIYNENFNEKEVKLITCILSASISITILIGDLFVFAKSTYYGYTVGNIFTWFNGIYQAYHPRTLASKFFFNEGNTIGILLFMILPMMYYFFYREENKKNKIYLASLIFIQSLSMQMLATRVATYGAVVMPVLFLAIYLFTVLITKTEKFQKTICFVTVIFAAIFAMILSMTPAVQNQKVDAKNDTALLHNGMADLGKEELANADDLVPGSVEYINFYVYMFETYGINARYIQSVPSMYYTEYYSYQVDPKFWVDVTFMPVFDRVSGRQIETIFFNYKYQNLTQKEKLLGMGYSTFMNGSIVLEQDFKQQIYTLGYIGELLCVLPWIFVIFYGLYHFIRKFKKLFTLDNLVMAVSAAAGLGGAWLSGHMLDQFITTTYLALLVAMLLHHIKEAE